MSQLLDLRAAVIARIKAVLPEFEVEGHLGRFNAEELKKFLIKAPAVRVAILNIADTVLTGDEYERELDCRAALAIYVVTKDGSRLGTREASCIAAVEAIVLMSIGQRWGLPFCMKAEPAKASNLYSSDTLASGHALWAIEIGQPLRLSLPTPDADDDTLTQLFIGFVPDVGPDHIDDYLGPLPEVLDV